MFNMTEETSPLGGISTIIFCLLSRQARASAPGRWACDHQSRCACKSSPTTHPPSSIQLIASNVQDYLQNTIHCQLVSSFVGAPILVGLETSVLEPFRLAYPLLVEQRLITNRPTLSGSASSHS